MSDIIVSSYMLKKKAVAWLLNAPGNGEHFTLSCRTFFHEFYRSLDDTDGPSQGYISSISGANKKRRRRRSEEEADEESDNVEHTDSSEEEEDDTVKDKLENYADNANSRVQPVAITPQQSCHLEDKPLPAKRQPTATPSSKPAIFIPVDRTPEIQVCLVLFDISWCPSLRHIQYVVLYVA